MQFGREAQWRRKGGFPCRGWQTPPRVPLVDRDGALAPGWEVTAMPDGGRMGRREGRNLRS